MSNQPSHKDCTRECGPPEDERVFRFQGGVWVALLYWCEPLGVWDTIVYITKAGRFQWVCSGVSRKRFVPVDGSCDKLLAHAVTAAVRSSR